LHFDSKINVNKESKMVRNKTHEAVKAELVEAKKEIAKLTRIKTAVQETDRQNAKLRKELQKIKNGK
jgi:hypothetical protein